MIHDRYYVRDDAIRTAIAYFDALHAYIDSNPDVDDIHVVNNPHLLIDDDFLYDFAGVDDSDAYNPTAYATALRETHPHLPDEIIPSLVDFLISVCAYTYENTPRFHLSDSVVDDVTRTLDHANFALVARNVISRLIDERNATSLPRVTPAYTSPLDVLSCMTHLHSIEIAYVPDPDNDSLRSQSHLHLELDPHDAFNDLELRTAFIDLIPHLDDSDPRPHETSPVSRSDFV